MSYRFKLRNAIAGEVSRIGLEQLEIAQSSLAGRTAGATKDGATAVHDARRCLKRLRALVRLVRPALSEPLYRRELDRLAAVGRLLSGARDQHIMRQTLSRIDGRFGPLSAAAGTRFNKLLANGSGAGAKLAARDKRQAVERLGRAVTFFTGFERRKVGIEHLSEGLELAYRRARRAFREAYQNPSDEAFHTWRKSAQVHWRHMQLLSRSWPASVGARASEAKEISRLLGDDHDLAVLAAFAEQRGKAVLSAGEVAALTEVCRAQQAELRRAAQPRGARLFAEKPGDLAEHVAAYWSAAQRIAELEPPSDAKKVAPSEAELKAAAG